MKAMNPQPSDTDNKVDAVPVDLDVGLQGVSKSSADLAGSQAPSKLPESENGISLVDSFQLTDGMQKERQEHLIVSQGIDESK